jgi:formylglycine-generating enzyme required for sulfatase activity
MDTNIAPNPQIDRQQEIAARQVAMFAEQYGEEMLDFACHAAFPLTLTTELAYLLRQLVAERYGLKLPWSAAPELLLSNLCDIVGHDLYAMEVEVRWISIEKLIDKFLEPRVNELAQWMAGYIKHRLELDPNDRVQVLGDPSEWIALACLNGDDFITQEIERYLSQLLAASADANDRFRWSAVVENLSDLLVQRGLQPLELNKLKARIAESQLDLQEPSTELERVQQAIFRFSNGDAARTGFPMLQSHEIEYATVVFTETEVESGDALYPFEFDTVQVDVKGKIVGREQCSAFAFREPLAPDNWLEMVAIPSGQFMRGSPESEHDRFPAESPQYQVTIQPFFIGKYPVTQAQWRVIAHTRQIEQELNPDPSDFKGDNRPVETVSREEAVEFCQRLSRQTGRDYRLPTEAEWEYACRAETITPFYFGKTITGELANYVCDNTYLQERKVNSKGETTAVGILLPNVFGLYDLHGNVWEWCLDHWHDNYKDAPTDGSAWLSDNDNAGYLVRGGSWRNYPHYCRAAARLNTIPDFRFNHFGFRVVCEIPRTL